jgi:hypothetical protein
MSVNPDMIEGFLLARRCIASRSAASHSRWLLA